MPEIKTYKIHLSASVYFSDLHPDDQEYLAKCHNKSGEYDFEFTGYSTKEALDDFKMLIPLEKIDDFNITIDGDL